MGRHVALYQGQSELLAEIAGFLAIATAELLAVVFVTAVFTRIASRTGLRVPLLPGRLRQWRRRIAPSPLHVFLVIATVPVGVELWLARPRVAAAVAAISFGTFVMASMMFGPPTEDGESTDEEGEEGASTPAAD
jgi:hypothetical protein